MFFPLQEIFYYLKEVSDSLIARELSLQQQEGSKSSSVRDSRSPSLLEINLSENK